MASNKDASVGMETDGSIPQNPPVTDCDLPGFEGLERLVVPSDRRTRSFIPFGIDGVLAVISPYGDVLRMTKYMAGHSPHVICLDAPGNRWDHRDLNGLGAEMDWQVQQRNWGLGIRLMAASEVEDPTLEWINGRWPCVRYGVDGTIVSILLTVNAGVLSQQLTIENPSGVDKDVHFALETGDAIVSTLRVAQGRWTSSDSSHVMESLNAKGCYRIAEHPPEALQHDPYPATDAVKGEARIAIFHNAELLKLGDHASIPIRDDDQPDGDLQSKSDKTVPSTPSGILQVAPKAIHKLVLQCELQPHSPEDSWIPKSLDVESFLRSEKSKSWSFNEHHELNPIFRRHLEHILCLCLVNMPPDQGEERRVPFINDVTLESESTPLGDL